MTDLRFRKISGHWLENGLEEIISERQGDGIRMF